MSYLLLKIFQNSQLLKTKIFTDDQVSIGSSEGLNLHLPELAPWHVLIEKKLNVFSVLDLGSDTGTFLNGQRIEEEALLKSGDRIQAGPYEFQFFVGSQKTTGVSSQQAISSGQTYVGPIPDQPGQTHAGQTHAGQFPPQSGQTHAGQVPPQSGQTHTGQVPPQSGQTHTGQFPPQSGQTHAGQVPPQSGQTHTGQVPPQSGQTHTGQVPPQSGQTHTGQFPPQSEQTHAGQFPPQSGQTHTGQVPPQSGQTHAGQVPPQSGQTHAGQFPPQSGQTHAGQVPSHAEQTHTGQVPSHAEQTHTGQVPSQSGQTHAGQVPPQSGQTHAGQVPTQQSEQAQVPTSQEMPTLSGKEQGLATNVKTSGAYTKIVKPNKKGFWNTYAPLSQIKNLEDIMEPSIGNLIEVNLVWRDRVLKTHTFSKSEDVYMGSGQNCQIKFPPMVQQEPYKLMSIQAGAKVFLQGMVKGVLFRGKKKETRTLNHLTGNQSLSLKPYEMLKLNFGSELIVYIRLTDKPNKMAFADLLNLKPSESLALLLAFLLTGLMFFYGTLYAPAFLAKDVDFITKDIRVAQIVFEKKPEKRSVVKYDLNKKTTKAPVVKKRKNKKKTKKIKLKAKINKKVKKISSPRKGKQGKMAAVAKGKKTTKPKVKLGSARPGGSLKTGKKGSSAKTKAPDPTKTGLLGSFGSGGSLAKLDKGATGPGGLVGVSSEYSGHGGTKDSYEGEGVGTKTKEHASGGEGESLVGTSGIKTGGKGLGISGSGTGGLGQRGRLSMEFSTEDFDVVGEIDREAIARVIKRNRAKFDRCYNQSLNDTPLIQGRMKMEWRIASNGKGTRARVLSSGIDNSALKGCVAKVLERLIFPRPPSGQIPEVSFTFNFST